MYNNVLRMVKGLLNNTLHQSTIAYRLLWDDMELVGSSPYVCLYACL